MKKLKGASPEEIRKEIVEVIKDISPIQIAYEAGVSIPTVYSFIAGKNFNKKIIEWFYDERR